MTRYAAKATVWLQIESDYPDGIGAAQHEVEWFINQMKEHYAKGPDGACIDVARAIDIEILEPKLREEPGESVNKLFFGDVCLDDGVR